MKSLAVLFNQWNLMRIVRLILAVFIATQAVQNRDGFAGVIAIFLLFQVATNTGCCGANGCSTNLQSPKDEKELVYEEVKK